jgi:hypothetical protein
MGCFGPADEGNRASRAAALVDGDRVAVRGEAA